MDSLGGEIMFFNYLGARFGHDGVGKGMKFDEVKWLAIAWPVSVFF